MSNTLYRDPENGRIAGVCAGLANHFGMETWLVRILTVSAFLLGFGFFVVVAYIAAVLILDKKPSEVSQEPSAAQQDHQVKQKPWQSGKSASQLIADLDREFSHMEDKVTHMEAYVTSSTFNVDQAFKKL
ncbi:phage shock protein C [Salinivibrio sp. PR6]|uniref:Phage shock protein C n=1 Tax=Salinivibrio siamensis TaxID=414286 RepID=A0ABX3K8H8_9GAMM|nr:MULTISPECIES: envelope stress response membrane protein PspC [Salinivibrio]OOE65362.1 phage shock protein C [Salinivibrio sp. IB868]OOE77089.1 phage shock protein C [Salinivibrio sp. ML290]OOE77425.1 phage shock protein C [Salinivibrio sp. IB870]OOE84003.1 phage shock protein C [Salinivibrio sp. PR6]OOE84567.1 phage shock protein C [Salinivibrio siamensis]